MDKRMRKRMALIKSQKNRVQKTPFRTYTTPKSFDEIREERESALEQDGRVDYDTLYDERDDTSNASIMTDCVSEMRRRRVYEMTHQRPYPLKSSKKKHSFWQPEEKLSRPAVDLSASFSERSCRSSIRSSSSVLSERMHQHELPSASKPDAARVLWKVETNNLRNDVEALVLNNTDERQKMKESFMKDEIMDGINDGDDEIMTPVRIKKFISVYDDVKSDKKDGVQFGQMPDLGGENIVMVNEETVTEISTATKALAAFVTSAAGVMKEAKTPEKSNQGKDLVNLREFQPKFLTMSDSTCDLSMQENVCQGAATPFKTLQKAFSMAATPANKLIYKVPTPKTTETLESSMDEADIMVTKLSLGDNNDTENIVQPMDNGVLWTSLFYNTDAAMEASFAGALDVNTKAMLEALVEGGALSREIDGTNMLKLFVDMYHKDTFDKIVYAVQELKGLHSLVICRGLDMTRPTYRTTQELKSLFDATKGVQHLDSLLLLNFSENSMTDVAMMVHGQPSLYRLQIRLIDGTLNGELLGVMTTAPGLAHVVLHLKESCSLGTLMNSKTLESLRVNNRSLDLTKSHVRTLVYSLQTNFNLTTLDLAPTISIEHFRSLCATLKQNYRLESLRVNLEPKTETESKIVAMELSNLFRENNFLINVWNYSYQSCTIGDASKRDLVAALRGNKSMKEFKFFSEDIGNWKNAKEVGGNPPWLKRNLETAATDTSTVYTMEDPVSVNTTRDGEASYSFQSGISSVANDFFGEDEFLGFCGIDCAAFSSIPTDCTNSVKKMGSSFRNWATATATPRQHV
eukprot:CAMPEP_0201201050 /NCGR_PEP_ID=MMETSP0851-20130426/162221_1 /ASSEMBLY_ACC=CAM_ASM_000631 /TAXON_ID=183588 /ORGANISM="Pseudo-nitzschia fraudulenta, Strain WWA7" /LENGTH=802 /DNA_ID=CAMNT_0047488695 /DNA_START=166 /DNA_END=2574 /DNA_ORIENTATION=-